MQMAQREMDLKVLRERFDQLQEQHLKVRTQLTRALKEIARLRALRDSDERVRIERERQEVQNARLQYIAKERQVGLLRDRSELETIKETLHRMALGGSSDPLGPDPLRSVVGNADRAGIEVAGAPSWARSPGRTADQPGSLFADDWLDSAAAVRNAEFGSTDAKHSHSVHFDGHADDGTRPGSPFDERKYAFLLDQLEREDQRPAATSNLGSAASKDLWRQDAAPVPTGYAQPSGPSVRMNAGGLSPPRTVLAGQPLGKLSSLATAGRNWGSSAVTGSPNKSPRHGAAAGSGALNALAHMRAERDQLLSSGVYSTDHPVVAQLSEEIDRRTRTAFE